MHKFTIRFKDTGELLLVDEIKSCNIVQVDTAQITEPGFYAVAASLSLSMQMIE